MLSAQVQSFELPRGRLLLGRLEVGIAPGGVIGDVNDIVDAIKRLVPAPPDVRYVPIEEARTKMGPYADALALDQLVRSPRARALGWTPTLHSVADNAARLLEEWRRDR